MVPIPSLRPVVRSARAALALMIVVLALILGAARPCGAQIVDVFLFSTGANETLQFNSILDEQVWEFDITESFLSEISGPLTQTGDSMFIDGEDIDAFSWRNGVYFLSTDSAAAFTDNPLIMDEDDIVRYDPGAAPGSRASLYFDPDLYGTDSGVDALSFHFDGDLLISFNSDETFAGLSVLDGDIVKFDPLDPFNTRTIFFSESSFTTGDENITAFEFVGPTEMYLTVEGTAGLPGLPAFSSGDIVLWNGTSASIVVAAAEFVSSSGGFDLDAIAMTLDTIPEPGGVTLLASAAALALARRRR